MKRLLALFLLAMPVSASAQAPPPGWSANDLLAVERCVGFILMGPEYTGIDIRGDTIDCKPAGNFTVNGAGQVHIRGEVGHQLSLRADDNARLNINLSQAGEVSQVFVVFDYGGVAGTVGLGDIGSSVVTLRPEWASLTGAEAVAAVARDHPGRSWETTSRVIAGVLAIEVGRSFRNRTGTPAFFFDRPGGDLRAFEMSNGRVYSGARIDSRFPHSYIEACTAACGAEQACEAWTIKRAHSGHQPICYLKRGGTQPLLARDLVSGFRLRLGIIPGDGPRLQQLPNLQVTPTPAPSPRATPTSRTRRPAPR
jgi:hypothetical protein